MKMSRTIKPMPVRETAKRDTVKVGKNEIISRSIDRKYTSPGVRGNDTTYVRETLGEPKSKLGVSSSGAPRYKYNQLQQEFNAAKAKKKR